MYDRTLSDVAKTFFYCIKKVLPWQLVRIAVVAMAVYRDNFEFRVVSWKNTVIASLHFFNLKNRSEGKYQCIL